MENQALSVLIADDDDGDRKLLKRLLKQTDLAIGTTETTNLVEALAACESTKFDCAILDYQMPGENGIDGIKALHQQFPYLAIIMVTGQGDESIACEAFKCGVSDYLVKDIITTELLRRTLKNVMEKTELQKQVDLQRQALENFASVLVHDLKAPIQHIRIFSKLMANAIGSGNYDELTEYYKHVDAAGDRMLELIETLHEYNKATGQKVDFKLVSIKNALEHALDNLGATADKAEISHDELPTVVGNEPQLVQLLQNLISNGIKYCQQQAPKIHVSASERTTGWVISVKDNGIGIPKRFHREIFDPFKRLHGASTYSGSGLGLATCKKIVDRHKGHIWCQSKEGDGTTFFFQLAAMATEKGRA